MYLHPTFMHFAHTSVTIKPKHCDPLYLLRTLGAGRQYCALLESADRQGNNDFSFLALGARDVVTVQSGSVRGSRFVPDGPVQDVLSIFGKNAGLGAEHRRLVMGHIGFISFEAARHFEKLALVPDPEIPDAMFVLPEVLLMIDHVKQEVTLTAHKDTTEDLETIQSVIHASPFHDDRKTKDRVHSGFPPPPAHPEMYRQTSYAEYCAAVRAIQEQILAGEVFQAVLSQELRVNRAVDAVRVYEHLREINPSPYMYYFRTPQLTIVGASPETLVRVEGDRILYRPIAGTRKRTGDPDTDAAMQRELLSDEKERSEHQMLVDLGRNDVGRVATIGSVQVQNAFRIEQYAHVYHLVSDIVGRVSPDKTSLDVLRSVFPAGTLTGAPKIRAMEIIRRLERSPRGIYGGAFGYVDESGNLDFAISIRTMVFRGDTVSLRVGAGIVKDSVPEREDDECLQKARSCLAALARAGAFSSPS